MQNDRESVADVLALAEHHERQGLFHARAAKSNASWYHDHERDTRRSAEHFEVAMALRALARTERTS